MKPKVSKPLFCTPVLFLLFLQSAFAQNALVNDGATLYLESGAGIYITGNLENKGSGLFTNAGLVRLTGNLIHNGSGNLNGSSAGLFTMAGPGTQLISGTRIPDFYNLSIDKPSGECQLQTGITVSSQLSFTQGNLFLNNQQVDLLTTGQLNGETETNRAYDLAATGTGSIKVVTNLNAPAAVNPGNLGAIITSAQNLGNTTVTRGHKAQFIHTANSVARYYDISPTANSGLNATLTFPYFDGELNGQAEADLVQWHLPNGSTVWLKRGGTVHQPGNYVTLSAIDSFSSRISLVSRNTVPLPVKLIDFRAEKIFNDKSLLTWVTADEVDFSRFDIERSGDGITWTTIAEVSGRGFSSTVQQYQYTDQQPLPALNRYRLKMVDTDGTFSYSAIRAVRFGNATPLKIYPTLTTSNSLLFIKGNITANMIGELYDSKGRLHARNPVTGNCFRLPALLPGQYLLKIIQYDSWPSEFVQPLIIF